MPRSEPPEERITKRVYEAVKAECGQPARSFYPSVRRRIKELIREVKDEAEVELVVLALVERDCDEFSAGYSLNWGSYDRIRRMMGVPDGAWTYALWEHDLPEGTTKQSAQYWLGDWYDSELERDEVGVYTAREAIKTLREHAQRMEIGL